MAIRIWALTLPNESTKLLVIVVSRSVIVCSHWSLDFVGLPVPKPKSYSYGTGSGASRLVLHEQARVGLLLILGERNKLSSKKEAYHDFIHKEFLIFFTNNKIIHNNFSKD